MVRGSPLGGCQEHEGAVRSSLVARDNLDEGGNQVRVDTRVDGVVIRRAGV